MRVSATARLAAPRSITSNTSSVQPTASWMASGTLKPLRWQVGEGGGGVAVVVVVRHARRVRKEVDGEF